MLVCARCLQAIESHEGKQETKPLANPDIHYGFYNADGSFTETALFEGDGEDYVECEWCGEMIPITDDVTEI